jgi:molybdopterin-synthase adenylyltransferase
MSDAQAHELALRGERLMKMIQMTPIVVCGVGALGSNLVDTLARQGFRCIKVVDFDRVEMSNIGTQVYGTKHSGMKKVQALQRHIYEVCGPLINLEVVDKRLTASNSKKILLNQGVIVDCFDNTESRQIIQNHVRDNPQRVGLHAGLYEKYGEVIWDASYKVPRDPKGGDVCEYPLARNVITLTVAVLAESIIEFLNDGTMKNREILLGDMEINEI